MGYNCKYKQNNLITPIKGNEKDQNDDFFVKIFNLKRTNPILVSLVAHRMREIREQHNHTQEYLTNNTSLKIWDYESEQKFPTLESIAKFCKFYQLTIEEFFAGTDYPPKEK